jgi:hypothetical protein
MSFSKTISAARDAGGSIICREKTTIAAGASTGTGTAGSRTILPGEVAGAGLVWMTVKERPQGLGARS